MILETEDYRSRLPVYQDGLPAALRRRQGEATPVSDLMGLKNHIFTVVPKVEVEAELTLRQGPRQGWRMPVFEAREIYHRFAGAALLLLEICAAGTRSERLLNRPGIGF